MPAGTLTLSIDLELAWGNWDNLTAYHLEQVRTKERPILARLLSALDRHEMAATFAFVAALLDPAAAQGREGEESDWHGPDLIERIRAAGVAHDLGSHGGRHRYFDGLSEAEASDEVGYARAIHDRHGLPFHSFVFPRNQVARVDVLARHGLRVYRGTDRAWHQRLRNRNRPMGRLANLADKMLPIPPETVRPERDGAMTNLPGSMLLLGRGGIRRLASPAVMRRKLSAGLDRAERSGGTFHLWFHPSNFWHETDRQFELFERFLADAAERVRAGRIANRTMADFGADIA